MSGKNHGFFILVSVAAEFSISFRCADKALRDLMLTLISNPINNASELMNISAITIMIVPIDPYKALYLPKLLTNDAKPIEESMLSEVASKTPGELNFHRFLTAGA